MAIESVPSEELRALLIRIFRAISERDTASLNELFSSEPSMILIGSDPDEWLRGRDAIEVFSAQLDEMPGIVLSPAEIVAYSSGDIGWGAARVRESFEDGNEVDKRVTAVFVIERGHWRVGHWHVSVGVSNEHSVGRPLTTSIDRLEKSVRGTRPDLREASAPDGTVTLLFSDIESSSTLLDRLGDAGFLELLAWHDGVIRDTSAEHRGFVVKSQGDGFMIAFPSATFALRCALTIQERLEKGFDRTNVRARIGLHAGETMHHAGDFYGRTVVIAARIGALAVGGEVLASDLVYALAGGLGTFRFSEPRPVTLKGLAGEFVVYRVLN